MNLIIASKNPGDELTGAEVNQIVDAVKDIGEQLEIPNYALSETDFIVGGTTVVDGHVVNKVIINPAKLSGNTGGNNGSGEVPSLVFNDEYFVVTQNGSVYNITLTQSVIDKLAAAGTGGDASAQITSAINTLRGGYSGTLQDLKTLIDNIGTGNTTPIAPVAVADDIADTLAYTHALGTGELETSTAGGAYAAYAPVNVGNVARVQGYWKTRVKAAAGRNASAYTESPAFTVANTGGGSNTGLLVPKILLGGGSATLANGNITMTGDNSRVVIANLADGPTYSTLAISIIDVAYDPSWNNNYVVLGLSTKTYGEAYGNLEFGMIFNKDSGVMSGKVILGNTDITFGYTLPLVSTTRLRVRAVKDVAYWRVFFEISTNSGASYIILNPAALGGQAGALSTLSINEPIFGQLPGSNTTVYKDTRYTL